MLFPVQFNTVSGRSAQGGFDPSAEAYFTWAGTLTAAEKNAVNQWFLTIKGTTLWSNNLLDRVYFMVGGTATTISKNALADSGHLAYTDEAGGTFNASGMKGNGTSFVADTGWVPSTRDINSVHGYVYCNSGPTGENQAFHGAMNGAGTSRFVMYEAGGFVGTQGLNSANVVGDPFVNTGGTLTGSFVNTRTGATAEKLYGNGASGTSADPSTLACPTSLRLLGRFDGTSHDMFSDARLALATTGGGINDSEAATLIAAGLAFNTALGRA